jgi:hypothetical protein
MNEQLLAMRAVSSGNQIEPIRLRYIHLNFAGG